MYIIRRLIGFGFLAAIYLICAGAYDAFIQGGTWRTPETISISELQKNVPANRHLIVTGGTPVLSKAVEYYQTRHGVRVANSEIYFIPIQDSALAPSASTIPPVLVKMTKEQADKIKGQGGFDGSRIQGVRMTRWDLESKAKDYLATSFGNTGVERMIILDYEREVVGIWRGFGQLIGGFVLLGALALASTKLDEPRSSRQTPPPVASAPPRTVSPLLAKTSVHHDGKRKRIALVATGGAIVLLLCVALLSNWRDWLPKNVVPAREEWRDWQLPIRIGDSLEAVRNKLGQESYNGNRMIDKYERAHHLGGYGHEIERQKSAAEGTITLYWQDKGISVYFQNGRAKDITIYTADRPERENDVRMRKYDGPIIAGVTATDRLDDLLRKLGKPAEVNDFNPNDKDYLWRRNDYVITTRIAMEDLVTTGLPFKAHQMEGVLSIGDVAPYLQAQRDEELRREALKKERAMVVLTGKPLSPGEIFKKYSGRVVEVQSLNSKGAVVLTGTGFIWRGNEVLTNCHIVEEARDIRIQQGEKVEGLRFSPGVFESVFPGVGGPSHLSIEQDWVQLFFNLDSNRDPKLPAVQCVSNAPEIGENVTVIGNPKGLTNSLSTGVVAGIREVNGTQWIQITAPISPGSSGSPVFDSMGRFIGLATMIIVDGQNLNFATPVWQIEAAIEKKVEPTWLPLKSIGTDKTFNQKKQTLGSSRHTPAEIKEFAEEFGSKYSDPEDKAQIFDAIVDAYEAQGEFLNAVKILQEKMERLGAELYDYSRLADLLEKSGDVVAMKRDLREGIMSGVRKFSKEHLPNSRNTAVTIAYMLNKLEDRKEAARWFDISLALLLPDIAESTLPILPQWYQTERAAREKTEIDVERLAPDDVDAYIDSLRQRWRSQVDQDVVALLRSWGLSEEKGKQLLRIGIDSIPAAYWEEEIRPKLTEDRWLLLRAKLDERKSL